MVRRRARAGRACGARCVDDLRSAWRIVLRAQFHDVITGTAIGACTPTCTRSTTARSRSSTRVAEAASSVLPRSDVRLQAPATSRAAARRRRVDVRERVRARARARRRHDRRAGRARRAEPGRARERHRGLRRPSEEVGRLERRPRLPARAGARASPTAARWRTARWSCGWRSGRRSRIAMRIALLEDEPWLRVEAAVALEREPRAAARGAPRRAARARRPLRSAARHAGAHARTRETDAERAQLRGAGAALGARRATATHGLAVFAPDSYGWNAVGLDGGGMRLGTSLLRSPRWPDPLADRGEQRLEYALVPTSGATISALEHAWATYSRRGARAAVHVRR